MRCCSRSSPTRIGKSKNAPPSRWASARPRLRWRSSSTSRSTARSRAFAAPRGWLPVKWMRSLRPLPSGSAAKAKNSSSRKKRSRSCCAAIRASPNAVSCRSGCWTRQRPCASQLPPRCSKAHRTARRRCVRCWIRATSRCVAACSTRLPMRREQKTSIRSSKRSAAKARTKWWRAGSSARLLPCSLTAMAIVRRARSRR